MPVKAIPVDCYNEKGKNPRYNESKKTVLDRFHFYESLAQYKHKPHGKFHLKELLQNPIIFIVMCQYFAFN